MPAAPTRHGSFDALRRPVGPLTGVLALLLVPAPASAAVLRVVDDRGRPQVAAAFQGSAHEPSNRTWSRSDGRIDVPWPPSSGPLRVSRDPGGQCGDAEASGVAVTPSGGVTRVVVPSLVGAPAAPGIDAEERRLFDLVAAHRAAAGHETKHSTTLTAAADAHAARLSRARKLDHCLAGSPAARAHAHAFPGPTVRENLSAGGADVAGEHFRRWLASPMHRSTIEQPGTATVGVAHVGGVWTLLVGTDCHDPAACAWSEPAVAPAGRSAGLRLLVRRSRRRARLRVLLAPGVQGTVRVTLRAGRRTVVRRRATGARALSVRLRRGRWRVSAAFSGPPPWRPATVRGVVRVR